MPLKEQARPNKAPPPERPSNSAAIDVYRMASVVEAEASGEPYECRCLVAEVLQNRAKSQGLDVSASSKIGIKSKKPSPESIKIAKKVLSSQHKHRMSYFLNPQLSTDKKWLLEVRDRKKIRCGKQLFF